MAYLLFESSNIQSPYRRRPNQNCPRSRRNSKIKVTTTKLQTDPLLFTNTWKIPSGYMPVSLHDNINSMVSDFVGFTKSWYKGLHFIFEYQSTKIEECRSRYYCQLCDRATEPNEIVNHCTSYIHLFRHVVRIWRQKIPFEARKLNFAPRRK